MSRVDRPTLRVQPASLADSMPGPADGTIRFYFECPHGIGMCYFKLPDDRRTDAQIVRLLVEGWRANSGIARDDDCIAEIERYCDQR